MTAHSEEAAPPAEAPLTWWPAPAKLNLFLHVTHRYSDGYHALQTVFQLIDRCDRIGLAPRDDGRIERRTTLAQVPPEQDLTVRAARSLQRHTGVTLGADIHLIKQIPLGGGLGGGSSDAATVLLALNALWNTNLGLPELSQLGLTLGADVPVFVHGTSAWAEGRGERLTALELPERWYLVVHPGVAVSTAEVFQAPELTRNSPVITIRDFSPERVGNVCEPVVRVRYPAVGEALEWLSRQPGAYGRPAQARMSGTGSCVFAAFETPEQAERVAARVPDRWSGFVARGLNRSPLHELLQR
jgi:4-diphosphocytidyl-2-C-methyl-D-erythritol kinase